MSLICCATASFLAEVVQLHDTLAAVALVDEALADDVVLDVQPALALEEPCRVWRQLDVDAGADDLHPMSRKDEADRRPDVRASVRVVRPDREERALVQADLDGRV